jgi:hypothetical protein
MGEIEASSGRPNTDTGKDDRSMKTENCTGNAWPVRKCEKTDLAAAFGFKAQQDQAKSRLQEIKISRKKRSQLALGSRGPSARETKKSMI